MKRLTGSAAATLMLLAYSAIPAVAADCAPWHDIGRIASGAFAEGQPANMPGARNCALDVAKFWCEFERGQVNADGTSGFVSAVATLEACFAGANIYRDEDEEGAFAFISTGEAVFYVEDAGGVVSVAAGPVR